ncbi:cytochrome c [Bartonella tamiae]|uniref:Cytochrome c domain-containing protein n=1 Tax=Bartonella tamiae Th239 TaxID=1094558 RepID=J1JYZ4_9HYPH|nr:cytochrome c [Bartonella tamiae]EJF90332.1 hypothetical protein ME5_00733 [Bartonella tamiae Th239]EJF93727.1 hypothetical protein MEG_01151 [Bartonella tamiae Th307]
MKSLIFSLLAFMFATVGSIAQDSLDKISKGEYIARASDCVACHTANENKPYAGGYAVGTPFGTVYSSNITSSKKFGIGDWSEKEFADAVRQGISKSKGRLYPAMPYDAYHAMSDDDVSALYAYLQTTKPVDEAPKTTKLTFPFNMRFLMIGWNIFNVSSGSNHVEELDNLSRGRYLVDVLGHCGTCHTPRNFMMGLDTSKHLAGSSAGGWHAPNITSDKIAGIGSWSDEEIATYLRTGHINGKGSAAGDMAEVIQNSTQYYNDRDLKAVVAYLRTIPAISDPHQKRARSDFGQPVSNKYDIFNEQEQRYFASVEDKENENKNITDERANISALDGQILFNNSCASCHQPSGSGVKGGYYPSLYHNSTVGAVDSSNLILTILNGVSRKTAEEYAFMPAYKDTFSDAQIASVANYVLQKWGNPDAHVSEQKVNDLRLMKPNYSSTPLLVLFWGGVAFALVVLLFIIHLIIRRKRTKY